jgi:hypothetical protein
MSGAALAALAGLCFKGAIAVVAQRRRIKLSGLVIDAEVNLNLVNGECSLSGCGGRAGLSVFEGHPRQY